MLFEWSDDIAMPSQGRSNEWYTPARYVDAARKVMGGIDLDPASCDIANKVVKATKYYTQEENGLMQPWYGRVWLNPPYGLLDAPDYGKRFHGGGATPEEKSLQTMFIGRTLQEYKVGNVEQVMLLVTANTTVRWFQSLWDYPMCTPFPKIGFIIPGSSQRQRQVFGNVFVYFGPNESAFLEHFSEFGRITKAIDTPKSKPTMRSLWEVGE